MKDMPRVTYLKKIGNRYYLQRRVPKDLESNYPPRPIKRPLGTSDYTEAKAKLQVELLRLEQEFTEKRRRLTRGGLARVPGAWLRCRPLRTLRPRRARRDGSGLCCGRVLRN